ncbi:agmatine deiminase family protein [Aliarcobacter skirrowii]|uniref:agmatine deiminase family protein n=1 Tax=Aliarcobacter skirrowii TaxID=28200 RepID=UPI0029B60955|nr:agmatine deiminase family protein [Aliarcobacter skirrowii]MDX4037692.1 agmatine deiminase family protein [Aliarcobacter skirrowii]
MQHESNNLINIFNTHNISYEIIEYTKDIWMRDFMPFCLDDCSLVSYIYEPYYLQNINYKNIKTKINYETNHIDLVIDGGNFVRYKNKAIMTDKIFKENPSKTKDEIIEIIKSKCNLEDLIIIPKQPYNIYGHSDSMVRWIDENSVLVNDFSIESKTFNNKLIKALQKHHLNIKAMKYSNSFFTKDRDWGAYLNFIKIEDILIVPIYGLKEDILVLKQLQNIYKNCIIEPIKFNSIIKEGGALHCVSCEKIGV